VQIRLVQLPDRYGRVNAVGSTANTSTHVRAHADGAIATASHCVWLRVLGVTPLTFQRARAWGGPQDAIASISYKVNVRLFAYLTSHVLIERWDLLFVIEFGRRAAPGAQIR